MAKENTSQKKNKNKLWMNYSVSGDKLERKNTFCPKCGVGFILANHKDRASCGKCGYTEVKNK